MLSNGFVSGFLSHAGDDAGSGRAGDSFPVHFQVKRGIGFHMDIAIVFQDDVAADIAEAKVGDPMASDRAAMVFDDPFHGIDIMKPEDVFNQHGDRAERGPAAEVRAHEPVAATLKRRLWFRRAVTFPDR